MSEHEAWQRAKYAQELDAISDALTALHPIGKFKAIGRLESALAFQQWLEWIEKDIHCKDEQAKCRNAIAILRDQHAKDRLGTKMAPTTRT